MEVFTVNDLRNHLILTLALVLVILYIKYLWKRRYLYIHSWKVEGPLSFPIIGCAYLFWGDSTGILERLMVIQKNATREIARIWLGPKLIYLLSKPEHIETVMNHPNALAKDSLYEFVSDGIGYGLLTAPVQKWKRHRKVLAPAFNQKILNSFVEEFAESSIIMADELRSVVGRKDLNLELFTARYFADILCKTAMGVDMNAQKDDLQFTVTIHEVLELINCRIFRIWYHPKWIWEFSPIGVLFKKYKTELEALARSVVLVKVAEHTENLKFEQDCLEAEIDEEPVYKPKCILDLILNGSGFTLTEMQEEINLFLLAGVETTATSICCLFVMLGMHQEYQQKVYEEVIDILGSDRIVEASDLPKMKFTERVIKESSRIFPLGTLIGRAIEGDIDLGWKFAIASMKVLVATIIRQYRIFTEYKSVEEIQLRMSMVLKLAEGSKVYLESR